MYLWCNMNPETLIMFKDALEMFIFLAVELTILFLAISYLVGVIQEYIPPEKIESILSSKNGKGYMIAALLGAITPFCSCSTIPFLKGLLRAKAGFGPMMVFLFASPLLNPIVIALFVSTFGFKIALTYFLIAMGVSVTAGFVLEKLGFNRFIKPFESNNSNDSGSCCANVKPTSKWRKIWDITWADFKVALPYLFIGVSIGAFIHGFVPTDFISKYASEDNLFAIPFAAVVGIPLYTRAIALIPLSAALVAKGMGIGAVMAFIIGSAGASLPEVILLKSMFRNQLIIAFLIVVLGMAIFSGLLFTVLF